MVTAVVSPVVVSRVFCNPYIKFFSCFHWPEFIMCCSQSRGLPRWLSGKESACQAGDVSLIPELGRSPGEGNGNSLQYSCLENPMDRGWASPWASKRVGHDLATKQEQSWPKTLLNVCENRQNPRMSFLVISLSRSGMMAVSLEVFRHWQLVASPQPNSSRGPGHRDLDGRCCRGQFLILNESDRYPLHKEN